MENVRVAFITVPSKIAEKMARSMVENRLCACVNVLPGVKSFYYWEDELRNETEALLLAKTTPQKIDDLIRFVKDEHPYKVPEIVTLPIAEGLPEYIDWVIEEMGKTAMTV